MNNNLIFSISLVALTILVFSCNFNKKDSKVDIGDRQPNIVLIISDDQGWTDYGFMGHKYIETPHLDGLASEGLTFTYGYSTVSLCGPSLASMITGLYPHQHKILGNDPVFEFSETKKYGNNWLVERADKYKPIIDNFEKLPTIPDLLKEKGYLSLQTGKWWEGSYNKGGFTNGMTHGDPKRGGRHGDAGLTIGREGLDTIYNFINMAKQQDKPFFIWYAPFMPHSPHNPPDSLLNKFLPTAPSPAIAEYWAMCEWFDITCGNLIDYIEQKKMRENTIFVFVCDNGWIQDPKKNNRYAPRSKRSPYEKGVRTPIIFNWPGFIKPQIDTSNVINSLDIAPTLLALCGISPTEDMQGINVLDEEKLANRNEVFCEIFAHDFSNIDSSLYYRVILTNPWKLIIPDKDNLSHAMPELYNIFEDPDERDNKAAEYPEIMEDLMKRTDKWWKK